MGAWIHNSLARFRLRLVRQTGNKEKSFVWNTHISEFLIVIKIIGFGNEREKKIQASC